MGDGQRAALSFDHSSPRETVVKGLITFGEQENNINERDDGPDDGQCVANQLKDEGSDQKALYETGRFS